MMSVGGSRHGPPDGSRLLFLFADGRGRALAGEGNQVAVCARSHLRGVKGSRGSP
jgi:hypothetical protein